MRQGRKVVLICGAAIAVGCTDTIKDVVVAVPTSDTASGTTGCLHEVEVPFGFGGDPVVSHCHEYDGPDPGLNTKHFPPASCDYDSYDGGLYTNYAFVESDAGNWFSQASDYYLCDAGDGAGTWLFEYDASVGHTCDDYVGMRDNWVLQDSATGLLELATDPWMAGLSCAYINYYSVPPASALVASAPVECTPGSATFDLAARHVVAKAADGAASLQLTAIAQTGVRFPERAWLRSVVVDSWGTLSTLSIAEAGEALAFEQDGSVSGGRVLAAGAAHELTLPPGAATMSAMLGTSGVDLADPVEMPQVTLSWSCEVDPSAPHFDTLPGHEPYLADLTPFGIEHPFVFWDDREHRMLRVAPLGRTVDFVQMPYGSDGRFSGEVPAFGAKMEGKIATAPAGLKITAARLTVGDDDPLVVTVSDLRLPAMRSGD